MSGAEGFAWSRPVPGGRWFPGRVPDVRDVEKGRFAGWVSEVELVDFVQLPRQSYEPDILEEAGAYGVLEDSAE